MVVNPVGNGNLPKYTGRIEKGDIIHIGIGTDENGKIVSEKGRVVEIAKLVGVKEVLGTPSKKIVQLKGGPNQEIPLDAQLYVVVSLKDGKRMSVIAYESLKPETKEFARSELTKPETLVLAQSSNPEEIEFEKESLPKKLNTRQIRHFNPKGNPRREDKFGESRTF